MKTAIFSSREGTEGRGDADTQLLNWWLSRDGRSGNICIRLALNDTNLYVNVDPITGSQM